MPGLRRLHRSSQRLFCIKAETLDQFAQQFHARLDELSATLEAAGETLKLGHMQQLREYGRALSERYPESSGA